MKIIGYCVILHSDFVQFNQFVHRTFNSKKIELLGSTNHLISSCPCEKTLIKGCFDQQKEQQIVYRLTPRCL